MYDVYTHKTKKKETQNRFKEKTRFYNKITSATKIDLVDQ